jgi:hypothetical protein
METDHWEELTEQILEINNIWLNIQIVVEWNNAIRKSVHPGIVEYACGRCDQIVRVDQRCQKREQNQEVRKILSTHGSGGTSN